MTPTTNKHPAPSRQELILLIIIPALIAAIYILPPLFVRAAYPVPAGKTYSQYALGQLYNYDEYGLYEPLADAVADGRPPYADLFTYEARNDKTLIPYFAPFYIIALVKLAVHNNQLVMPALDVIFAFIGFFAVYFFTLALVPSRKTAVIASALALLPPPLIRIFELAGMRPANELLRATLFTGELPMMSRTYSPQMTFPLMLLFLILAKRVESGDNRKRTTLAAAVVLAASFYFSFILGVILSIISAKILVSAVTSKDKARLKSFLTVNIAAAVLSLHCVYLSIIFNRRFTPSSLDKFLNSEPVGRLAPANIAAILFFAALYAVYAVPKLKKPAFLLALASMPASILLALKGGAIGSNFFLFTPAIYLLLAASVPKKSPPASLFLYMAATIETAILLRIATGKSHADVHYFYRTFFLPFAPILIATGIYNLVNAAPSVRIARAIKNPRFANAVFISIATAILALGAPANMQFARENRRNYYIQADQARAAAWLREHTKQDSVVMSFDPQANLYIQLTARKYLFLPRPGMSPFSTEKLTRRLAVASTLLGIKPNQIDWSFWPSLGFYLFDMHTTNPECKQALVSALKTDPPAGAGQFRLDYLWYGPAEKALSTVNPDSVPQLRKTWSGGEISIYKLTKNHPLFAPREDLR